VDFTVIGDPVNTAARVEELTRETGDAILITEATRRLLRTDHGGFMSRGAARLKGKTAPTEIHAPCLTAAAREAGASLALS
jgi:class 3 adenylate cyclase